MGCQEARPPPACPRPSCGLASSTWQPLLQGTCLPSRAHPWGLSSQCSLHGPCAFHLGSLLGLSGLTQVPAPSGPSSSRLHRPHWGSLGACLLPSPLQSRGLAGLDQSSWPAGGWALELNPRSLEPLVSRVGTHPMPPPLAGLPDQTRSLLRSHQFPDPGYLSPSTLLHAHPHARPTSFSSHVSGQSALGRPLPGARHSAGSHILGTSK